MEQKKAPLLLWLSEVTKDDIALVGGKAANLGELYRNLNTLRVRVPNGFVVTTEGWRALIAGNSKLREKILTASSSIDYSDEESLRTASSRIWDDVLEAAMPRELEARVAEAYARLETEYGIAHVDVAVRSSAVMEDLKEASFAGQHATFLNRRRVGDVLRHIQECFASLFTSRALSYRNAHGFPGLPESGIAVVVQKMVHSNWASSGVAFSHESVSTAPYMVQIDAGWGLGEFVVGGQEIIPDRYFVAKPHNAESTPAIIGKELGTKEKKMIYGYREHKGTYIEPTSPEERDSFCLTDTEVLELTRAVLAIERHYQSRDPLLRAVDIEWAKDGDGTYHGTGSIFIVQVRATTFARDPYKIERVTVSAERPPTPLLTGFVGSPGAGQGPVRVIEDANNSVDLRQGEVLVTYMTSPDWVPAMRRASAIVTDQGGQNCHAAIVAREMVPPKPCIVGTGNATTLLKNIEHATVDCSSGARGKVFAGLPLLERAEIDLRPFHATHAKIKRTKVMQILADPRAAATCSFYPNDGIGLARWEFIIANLIGIHPKAVLESPLDKLLAEEELERFQRLVRGYRNPFDFFVRQLAFGTAQLAASIYPNPIIVRFSDFKTNEYKQLLGGAHFEPHEENPMIGWRGASRYYDLRYERAFREVECHAIRMVREEMGFLNVKAMIPFCRTLAEARQVVSILKEEGLGQGRNGFELYCMVETPSNVIQLLLPELSGRLGELFDGFSIGSNDLTQLTYGLDRDSGDLAHIANERDSEVRWMIATAIERAGVLGKPIGICGQAPSNFPEYAAWLVGLGINSISVLPDAIPATIANVARAERKQRKNSRASALPQ